VVGARGGDLAAFALLVEATQSMAYAVALRILRQDADARDATQDAYVTGFRRLRELSDARAFAGWLRRIVIAISLNHRRRTRGVWLELNERDSPPILDEEESQWSYQQQRQLASAVLTLSDDERRICELHYHGKWSAERIARQLGLEPSAMRKRLQRVREKLRKEIEMNEQEVLATHPIPKHLPKGIVELLARPRLSDLPENPVGGTSRAARRARFDRGRTAARG
jgi:RNA polymerase sigma-70 factor (ECF subfamily)